MSRKTRAADRQSIMIWDQRRNMAMSAAVVASRGDWAVHASLDKAAWSMVEYVVTHVPTGAMLPVVFVGDEGAKKLMAKLPPSWCSDADFGPPGASRVSQSPGAQEIKKLVEEALAET